MARYLLSTLPSGHRPVPKRFQPSFRGTRQLVRPGPQERRRCCRSRGCWSRPRPRLSWSAGRLRRRSHLPRQWVASSPEGLHPRLSRLAQQRDRSLHLGGPTCSQRSSEQLQIRLHSASWSRTEAQRRQNRRTRLRRRPVLSKNDILQW